VAARHSAARADPAGARGPSSWWAFAALLTVVYVAAGIGVDLAVNGRWVPSAERVSHFLLVPLAQSVVVWWLVVRRRSSRP
jgi:hypothetical protein